MRMDHRIDRAYQCPGIGNIAVIVGVHHQAGRVPAETIHVTLAEPHREIILDEVAHLLAAEIRPRIAVRRYLEVGIALVKINPAADWPAASPAIEVPHVEVARAVVVVNDIQQYRNPPKVTGLNESLKAICSSISGVFYRERLRRVVSPTVVAGKFRDWQHFN